MVSEDPEKTHGQLDTEQVGDRCPLYRFGQAEHEELLRESEEG